MQSIDRRSAIGGMMGCLMGPFIPALKLPDKQPEPVKQSFFVKHYDDDFEYHVSLERGSACKWYRENSVASWILINLFDEARYDAKSEQYSTSKYSLLEFLWDRHDHDTVDII